MVPIRTILDVPLQLRRIGANHTFSYFSDDHFGFVLGLLGKRYVHIYHGNWPDAMWSGPKMFLKGIYFLPLYFFTILLAKCVLHVSNYMKTKMSWINSNSLIVRNGIKRVEFAHLAHTPVNKGGKLNILMVGNIDQRKYRDLLKVLKRLDEIGTLARLRIDIYGNVNDKKLGSKISQFGAVRILGFRPQIDYGAYNLFLMLSRSENLSISVCEALENRLPVFCYDVGGLAEVVTHATNGFVVKPGDINLMVELIEKASTSDLLSNLNVDRSVLRDFDWGRTAETVRDVLTNKCASEI